MHAPLDMCCLAEVWVTPDYMYYVPGMDRVYIQMKPLKMYTHTLPIPHALQANDHCYL